MPLIFLSPYNQYLLANYPAQLALLMHMDGNWTDVKGASFAVGSGSPTPTSVAGKFTNAYRFGSTGYIRSSKKPFATLGTQDFTFEFWVRINSLGGVGDHDYVNFDLYPIQIGMHGDSKLYFEKYGGGWATCVSSTTLNTSGAWQHVAICRKNGTTKMFFNGVTVATTTSLSGVSLNQTGDFLIGARNDGNNRTTSGNYDIDEIRMLAGVAMYDKDFIPPASMFADSDPLTNKPWSIAWKSTSDNYNKVSSSWTYDVALSTVASGTEAAIAVYDPSVSQVTPTELFYFPMPPDWKLKHPLAYGGNDFVTTVTEAATGIQTANATVRYGYYFFGGYMTDTWKTDMNYGRLGILGTKAPFYSAFASTEGDLISTSDKHFVQGSASSPTKRMLILFR